MTALWQLTELTLSSGGTARLTEVCAQVMSGVTAVVGYSGAGKTSLLNLLVGVERPSSGIVQRLFSATERDSTQKPASRPLPLYWVPQSGGLWGHLTARQHLKAVFPGETSVAPVGWDFLGFEAGHEDFLDKLLRVFDLHHRRDAFPGQLSMGEQSRLSVCRALAANADVLVMDEPLSHVDPVRRPGYWRFLNEFLRCTGTSLVFSTHEPDVAVSQSETVICLEAGRMVYQGRTSDLYHDPPNVSLAQFLGPVNWFDGTQLAAWFPDMNSASSIALRPEQLAIIPDDSGGLEVTAFTFCGSYAETHVKQMATSEHRVLTHRPAMNDGHVGRRVRLQVVT